MRGFIKSTFWQGSIMGIVVLFVLFASKYRLIIGMLDSNKKEGFSYQDSYFIVYHGIFEDYPKIAILFWAITAIILSIIVFGVVKYFWTRFR